MDATITLRKYLEKGKVFVIPDFQRGYIWGKKKPNSKDTDSVTYIMNTIISKFIDNSPIFLQGVTVTEEKETITLIDGQQRTTFLYILLKYLNYTGTYEIRYDVRKESEEFLNNGITSNHELNADEEFQDIYFFKNTWRIIDESLSEKCINTNGEKDKLLNFLLDNIKFLYINIPDPHQAKKVFSMMNGNRAKMLEQELIKAELLRLVSTPVKSNNPITEEWELNMLRSRYARNWDRWLHWWNRDDVRKAFNIESQLGYLLISVMPISEKESVTFESFCKRVLKSKQSVSIAKATFDRLRRSQKLFEDAFNNSITHNKIGAILRLTNDPIEFVKYYFGSRKITEEELDRYYRCTFLDMTHKELIKDGKPLEEKAFYDKFIERYNAKLAILKNPTLYIEDHESAYRLLLRLNIDEDNLQENGRGRKFDFQIWNWNSREARSLEHIYPKSKVFHRDSEGLWRRGDDEPSVVEPSDSGLLRDAILPIKDTYSKIGNTDGKKQPDINVTEHSIGNLVLLYKDDNSVFNNSDFKRKKEIFLIGEEGNRRKMFKSRHLLHTIYHFAEAEWGAEQISRYTALTLEAFQNSYIDLINEAKSYAE